MVERVKALGVDFAQGNWISPPRPLGGAETNSEDGALGKSEPADRTAL